jgi:integrase
VRCRLNQKKVEAAALPPLGQRQHFVWDSELKGFGVRINDTGAKSFVLQTRAAGGGSKRIVIGNWPGMTLSDARIRCRELLGQIAQGGDPFAERRSRRAEPTLGEYIDIYEAQHLSRKRSGQKSLKVLKRYLPVHWLTRRLSTITRAEVIVLHQQIGERGHYAANGFIRVLRALYNHAIDAEVLSDGARNPAKLPRNGMFDESKRGRVLSTTEVAKLDLELLGEPHVWRTAFLLWLLLGVRRGELLSARWEQFALDDPPPEGPVWTIPGSATKNKMVLRLPLVPEVVALLSNLPSYGKAEFLFLGVGATGHIVEPKSAWSRVRTRAGFPEVRLHDLRRTAASWLKERGFDDALIGRLLNHTNSSVTGIYARFGLGPLRAALEELTAAFRSAMPQTFALLLPAAGASTSDGDAEYAYHGLLRPLYGQH